MLIELLFSFECLGRLTPRPILRLIMRVMVRADIQKTGCFRRLLQHRALLVRDREYSSAPFSPKSCRMIS